MSIDNLDEYALAYRQAMARELRTAREANGVTYEALSAYTGMQIKTLHRYLSGERDVTLGRLRAIAEGIGVDLLAILQKVEESIG